MGCEVGMNKRLEWIDVCNGILIITIVLMHIDFSFWSDNVVGEYIVKLTGLYKVSIFFCVAGLTLNDKKLKDTWKFIKGKVENLYVKIVTVGVIAVLLHNVLIRIGFYQIELNYSGKVMKTYGIADFFEQIILSFFMANREVIIGPMWYANVLFMALVILALQDCFIRFFVKSDNARIVRFVANVGLMLISSALTNLMEFTIPRFNNTLTAVFLIDLCQLLYRKLEWKFNNQWAFAISALLLVNLPMYGHLSMTNNQFLNPAFLFVVAICGMYVLYYISQKVTGGYSKILAFIGKQSFWIMALHFTGFKIGSVILNKFIGANVSSLIPATSDLLCTLFYLFAGIFIPCAIGVAIEKLKGMISE